MNADVKNLIQKITAVEPNEEFIFLNSTQESQQYLPHYGGFLQEEPPSEMESVTDFFFWGILLTGKLTN